MTAAAVVIGLDTIVGLQTARVLHRRGVEVIGLAADPTSYCARTRTARVIASPTSGDGLLETLHRLSNDLADAPVLFPCRDPSVITLSEHRDELPGVRLSLPDHDVLVDLVDKGRFALLAERLGHRVPRTVLVTDEADLGRAIDALTFPCVLKPVFRDDVWQDRSPRAKGFLVEDAGRLRSTYADARAFAERFVVQEWIPGPVTAQFTCNALFSSAGRPLGSFVSRKVRQWPPETGQGSMGVAEPDDEVAGLTLSLFENVGLRGLGYLEVKRDVRDGSLVMVEANIGRPTGRSALADVSGVELLHAMYRDLTGGPVSPLPSQEPTRRAWVHLRRDLQAGARQWRQGDVGLAAWLRSYRRPLVDAVMSIRDPAPMAVDLLRSVRKVARGAGSRER